MNDIKTQAKLDTLESQRNNALNGLAIANGEVAMANAVIGELKKQLDEANASNEKLKQQLATAQAKLDAMPQLAVDDAMMVEVPTCTA